VDMANNNQGGRFNSGPELISSSNTHAPWGWTLGFGVGTGAYAGLVAEA
jgi:hypothetical protein